MESPDLPLDWTRVARNPCCVPGANGGMCPHRRRRQLAAAQPTQRRRPTTTYHGQVIVCLLDGNPDWFQAYFFLQQQSQQDIATPPQVWGLLGIQKEIDECLQCSEGGYRVVDLKITSTGGSHNQQKKHTSTTFVDVEWTGGDMMDLKGSGVQMQADKILTSTAALPVLEQVFGSLTRRVREESTHGSGDNHDNDHTGNNNNIDMLEVFPELTIVVGRMQLEIPDE